MSDASSHFHRYFYRYIPPRPLEEIEADSRGIEADILTMLAEVTGCKLDDGSRCRHAFQSYQHFAPLRLSRRPAEILNVGTCT